MHRTQRVHLLALAFAVVPPMTAACGKGGGDTPRAQQAPATSGSGPTAPAPSPSVGSAGAPAAPVAPAAPAAPVAQAAPTLDDSGLVGLTAPQMASAAALQAAFPSAKVTTGSRRFCPPGTAQTSATECAPQAGGEGGGTAGPVRAYQVLTVQGSVARAGGAAPGSYLLQVIADGERPVNISYDVERLEAADLAAMPATLAAAQQWRPQASCTWDQYPEPSAHLRCRYRGSKLRVVTQGPTPKVDEDSETASAEWDIEPAELPTWIAAHGSDKVTSVEWGDDLGAQAY